MQQPSTLPAGTAWAWLCRDYFGRDARAARNVIAASNLTAMATPLQGAPEWGSFRDAVTAANGGPSVFVFNKERQCLPRRARAMGRDAPPGSAGVPRGTKAMGRGAPPGNAGVPPACAAVASYLVSLRCSTRPTCRRERCGLGCAETNAGVPPAQDPPEPHRFLRRQSTGNDAVPGSTQKGRVPAASPHSLP